MGLIIVARREHLAKSGLTQSGAVFAINCRRCPHMNVPRSGLEGSFGCSDQQRLAPANPNATNVTGVGVPERLSLSGRFG